MTRQLSHSSGARAVVAIGALLTVAAAPLGAQACLGAPATSSVSYGYEQYSVGSSNGATARLVGSRFAASLGANMRSITSTVSGYGGQLGLTGIIGGSRLSFCPGITIGGTRDTWDPRAGLSTTINAVGLGAGLGVGYSQDVGPVSIIPFARVGYGYNLVVYDVTATNAETNVTGDTLSGVTIEYGAVAHYRYFFGGVATSRLPGQTGRNPDTFRLILGVTFSDRDRRK